MPTIVNLRLRDHGHVVEPVDLDALTPRARALAETVQARDARAAIAIRSRATLRDMLADPALNATSNELDKPLVRIWEGWSFYPEKSRTTPIEYLEEEARRIPPTYTIVGIDAYTPVPSAAAAAADTGITVHQVVALLAQHDRSVTPGTWRSYVAREQAPQPIARVGRTPLWDYNVVAEFAVGGDWRAMLPDEG